jgi:hypothetical protein
LAIQQSNYWPSFEDDERKKEEDTVGGVFPIQVQIEDKAGFGENKQKNGQVGEGSARKWMGKLPGLPECGAVVLDTASARYLS